ncbi:MAG: hypothetical protein JSS76_17570 [Bacteroidetes bacterium]|nr:hypothetical protein [Bacteroidota bacterium]
MKRIILFFAAILALVVTQSAYSQSAVSYKYGNDLKMPKGHYSAEYVSTGKGITAISTNEESIVIDNLDDNLNVVQGNVVNISDRHANSLARTIIVGKRIYNFYSVPHESKNRLQLFAQELNIDKAQLVGSAKNILSKDFPRPFQWWYGFSYEWACKVSADNEKLMILYKDSLHPKEEAMIEINVYDPDLRLLWSKASRLPITENKVRLISSHVHNNGDAYLLIKIHEEDDYKFEIIKISNKSDQVVEIPIVIPQKYVTRAALELSKDGKITCAAFYSDDAEKRSAKGAFIWSIDPVSGSLKPMYQGQYDFPAELTSSFEKQKALHKMDQKPYKGADGEIANLDINISVTSDGAVTVLGEQNMSYTSDYLGPAGTNRSFSGEADYNLDIYAMHITPTGQLSWAKRISKRLMMVTDVFGYRLRTIGSNHYFIFFDNEENLNLSKDDKPTYYTPGHGTLVYVKIAADGTMTKSSIFKIRDIDMKFCMSDLKNIGEQSLVFEESRGRRIVRPFVLRIE